MTFKFLKSMLAGVALFSASLAAVQPAQADAISDIQGKGVINIGMLVDFPPLGFINAENEPDGYDPDIGKLFAEKLGVDINIVPVTGPNRIPYLLSGQADILISSLAITPERAEKVDFTTPYAAVRVGIFGGVDVPVTKVEDLDGRAVGVTRASGQDVSLTAIASDAVEIRRFDDDVSAVQALLSGQVELIGVSNIGMKQIHEMRPGQYEEKFEMNRFILALGIHPDQPEMMDYANTFLAEIEASGQLPEIYEKWFAEPFPEFAAQ